MWLWAVAPCEPREACAGCDACATTVICMPWCGSAGRPEPWATKCKWNKCKGCGDCSAEEKAAAMSEAEAEAEDAVEEEEAKEEEAEAVAEEVASAAATVSANALQP